MNDMTHTASGDNGLKKPSARYAGRLRRNRLGLSLSMFAMAVGLAALFWILGVLLYKGLDAISWSMFVESTPAPGSAGGLANAMWGSLLLVGVSALVSTPVGILAGIYLSEYGASSRFGSVTRFVTDIMLSAPSIVIGLFVYALVVAPMGYFSGWAGSIALALIALPVVVRTTENMLRLVPAPLREAATALGAPKWRVSVSVVLRASSSGVVTGILLAIARVSGETAPLLFTALSNQFMNSDMSQPIASLPVVIYQFAMSPYEDWVSLAWGGALMVTFTVLLINIVARVLFRDKSKG